jgi:hypothetical protein
MVALELALLPLAAFAQSDSSQSAEELAKKLSNPIASLISVPFQGNYDEKIGPARDGHRFTLNIQPVIPVELNKDSYRARSRRSRISATFSRAQDINPESALPADREQDPRGHPLRDGGGHPACQLNGEPGYWR